MKNHSEFQFAVFQTSKLAPLIKPILCLYTDGGPDYEMLIWKSEFLNSIHTLASKNLKDFWHVSINCIHIFNCLELKGNPASDEVEELFAKILPVDPSVQQTDTQKDGKNFKTT